MAKKLLVAVDVQNDFVEGGALPYGYPEKSNTDNITAYVIRNVLDGNLVVATRDTHYDNYLETLEGKKLPIKHCMHDTHGWELIDGLKTLARKGKMVVFDKSTFGSPLIAEYINNLKGQEEVDEVEIVGYMTEICVLSNAILLRARFPNLKITVLSDLCGGVNKESHTAALKVLIANQIDIK